MDASIIKKLIPITILFLILIYPVYSSDYFPDVTMGMNEIDVRSVYPDLRFERNDTYFSVGNAVITRCYIDPQKGLYRIEANMRDDDPEFMNAIVQVFNRTHGSPVKRHNEAVWNRENNNTFEDPNTAAFEVSLRGGWITVAKTFTNTPFNAPVMPFYAVGDSGPAGGIVFFDRGAFLDGWRYLECAPEETEKKAIWAPSGSSVRFTTAEFNNLPEGGGEGGENTRILLEILNRFGLSGCAVQLIEGFSYGGAEDWYVPTIYECHEMLRVLRFSETAGISSNDYWSSSIAPDRYYNYSVRYVSWDGNRFGLGITSRTSELKSVRFIRRF